jgi:hypothetical protein
MSSKSMMASLNAVSLSNPRVMALLTSNDDDPLVLLCDAEDDEEAADKLYSRITFESRDPFNVV